MSNEFTNWLKTPIAAKTLGVAETQLYSLLRKGKIPPPAKDSSGDYCWTPADLDAARQAMEARRQRQSKPVTA